MGSSRIDNRLCLCLCGTSVRYYDRSCPATAESSRYDRSSGPDRRMPCACMCWPGCLRLTTTRLPPMASSSASFNFYSLVMVPSPIYFHFKSDLRFTSLQLYRPRCSVLSPCVGIPTELHQHGTPDYLDLLFSDRANSCKYRSSLHKISCLAA